MSASACDLAHQLDTVAVAYLRAHPGYTPRDAVVALRIVETAFRRMAGDRVKTTARGSNNHDGVRSADENGGGHC